MKHSGGIAPYKPASPLHVILADDDKDDRFFFHKILRSIPIETQLTTVEDGEELMAYLSENCEKLPDALFLDLNMPKRNGMECLAEIKGNRKLRSLPVIIYSTSAHDDVADLLYHAGAHYFFRKTDITELKQILRHVLTLLSEGTFARPAREEFMLMLTGV
jgi:CheY-like chemotaxis protein